MEKENDKVFLITLQIFKLKVINSISIELLFEYTTYTKLDIISLGNTWLKCSQEDTLINAITDIQMDATPFISNSPYIKYVEL